MNTRLDDRCTDTFFHRDIPRHLHFPEQITACTNAFNTTPVNQYVYLYDSLGRPTNRNAHAFAYDRRGQLTRATLDSTTNSYAYDYAGNRTTFTDSLWGPTTWNANALKYDWEEYPVLRFDFADLNVESVEYFRASFADNVRSVLRKVGIEYDSKMLPGTNFGSAIELLAEQKGKKVVVLIDEYDIPVGHSLDNFEKAEAIRDALSSFYIQIKSKNAYIRFMMMTGVSKFMQLSVFSALNNLKDLTLTSEAADLLGYSDEDLGTYFGEHMREHAKVMKLSYEAYREGLRKWSDGYRFSPDLEVQMYNPYSIANTLVVKKKVFVSTWSTGSVIYCL